MVDPSPIESLSTLEAKSGPEIRKEIYNFKDKADREIALRFDFTVGTTRHVASKQFERMPAKFSSFGGVWRYDEPQKGRYRYFHQWNVEVFGLPSVESESEIIEFASVLFAKLGIGDSLICINHRELVESFIKKTYPGFEFCGHAFKRQGLDSNRRFFPHDGQGCKKTPQRTACRIFQAAGTVC